MADQTEKEAWHLDKKVPIALIVTLLAQFAGFVWFGAKMDSRIDQQAFRIERLEASDRDQGARIAASTEAFIRLQEQMANLTRLVEQIDRRLAREQRQ